MSKAADALPLVAVIGRANVGKSTLFNRLLREGRSLVEDTPGVTRDRVAANAWIERREVLLVIREVWTRTPRSAFPRPSGPRWARSWRARR